MNYNDNQLSNNTQINSLSQSYILAEQERAQDLINLYDKMIDQREYLYQNNSDHAYDNLIESTNNHLNSLQSIIGTFQLRSRQVSTYAIDINAQPHYRPYINSPTSTRDTLNNQANNSNLDRIPSRLPNTNNNIPNIDNQLELPNLNQDRQFDNQTGDNSSSLPNNNTPTTDNGSNNQSINRNNTSNSRTQRNSPLQSRYLSSIVKSIFGKKLRSQILIQEDKYRNRFHNVVIQTSRCNHHKKIITNECDILRLLLLYITIHPHCRYTCQLSEMAEVRIRMLSELI